MKTIQAISAFFLVFLLVLGSASGILLSSKVSAADEPILKTQVSPRAFVEDGTVTVRVTLSEAVTTQSFGLNFSSAYDHDAFEWVSGNWSEQILEKSILDQVFAGKQAAFATEELISVSGTVFTFVLRPVREMTCRDSFEFEVSPGSLLKIGTEGDQVSPAHRYDDPADKSCNECGEERTLPQYAQTVHRGDEVTVTVSAVNGDPVSVRGFGLDFRTAYDASAFEWVSGTWSQQILDQAALQSVNGGYEAVFAAKDAFLLSGEVFTMVLRVKADAPFASYDVIPVLRAAGDLALSVTEITVHQCRAADTFETDGARHWKTCTVYGCTEKLSEGNHEFVDSRCTVCGLEQSSYLKGDVDGNGSVEISDAIYLLYHVNFEEDYAVNQPVDFDGNGELEISDAIYLLYHVNFEDDYPLH